MSSARAELSVLSCAIVQERSSDPAAWFGAVQAFRSSVRPFSREVDAGQRSLAEMTETRGRASIFDTLDRPDRSHFMTGQRSRRLGEGALDRSRNERRERGRSPRSLFHSGESGLELVFVFPVVAAVGAHRGHGLEVLAQQRRKLTHFLAIRVEVEAGGVELLRRRVLAEAH